MVFFFMAGGMKRRAQKQLRRGDSDEEDQTETVPLRINPNAKIIRAKRRNEQSLPLEKGLFSGIQGSWTKEERLKGLNRSFIDAAKSAYEKNEVYNMAELFVQYEKYKKEIDTETESKMKDSNNLFFDIDKRQKALRLGGITGITGINSVNSVNNTTENEVSPTKIDESVNNNVNLGTNDVNNDDVNNNISQSDKLETKSNKPDKLDTKDTKQLTHTKQTKQTKNTKQLKQPKVPPKKTILFEGMCKVFVRKTKRFEPLGFNKILVEKKEEEKGEEKEISIYDENNVLVITAPLSRSSIRSQINTKELIFIDIETSAIYKIRLAEIHEADALREACK